MNLLLTFSTLNSGWRGTHSNLVQHPVQWLEGIHTTLVQNPGQRLEGSTVPLISTLDISW